MAKRNKIGDDVATLEGATVTHRFSDAASAHPECLVARVQYLDGESKEVFIEHVVRDEDGAITGRDAAPGFSNAERKAAHVAFHAAFASATKAAGFTETNAEKTAREAKIP